MVIDSAVAGITAPRDLLGDLVRLRPSTNDGIAFGLLQGTGWLPVMLAAVVIPLLVVFAFRQTSALVRLAIGFIAGGAIANLTERLLRGAVLDYVDMGIGSVRWPTYNMGDVGISIGVLLILSASAGFRAPRDPAG